MVENESHGDVLVGTLAGVVAALVSAGVWALVPYFTEHEYAIVAIALGAFVGFAVRWGGRGSSITFGIVGAVCALLAIALGNVLAVVAIVMRDYDVTLREVLAVLDFQAIWEVLSTDFTPIDAIFYGIAIFEGFRFAIVPADHAAASASHVPAA